MELEAIAKSLNLCARAVHDEYVNSSLGHDDRTELTFTQRTHEKRGRLTYGPRDWSRCVRIRWPESRCHSPTLHPSTNQTRQ